MDRTRLINLVKLLVFLAAVGIFVLALLTPDLLFVLINVIPLPFWFLMIFLPRRPITQQITSNYLVFLVLGAFYIFATVAALVNIARAGTPIYLVPSGLAVLFGSPAAALLVWLHMLTMDLLGGHWLYHEAQRINAPVGMTSISLVLTFLFAPLGIFVFVLWRVLISQREEALAHQQPSIQQPVS